MSKRTLIAIIVVLLLIDIVAALWYLSLRIEREDVRAEERKQLTEQQPTSAKDEFKRYDHAAYFVSRPIAGDDNPGGQYSSSKIVKVNAPVSVNGSDNLRELDHALIARCFGKDYMNYADAFDHFLNAPKFNSTEVTNYNKVQQAPPVREVYSNIVTVVAEPCLTSKRLLVMRIEHRRYNGASNYVYREYVHYDRVKHCILTQTDILRLDNKDRLVNLINRKIDTQNLKRKEPLQRAYALPTEIFCNAKGILFEYPHGELAPQNVGAIEIFIPYQELKDCLMPSFVELLNANADYKSL